MEKKEALTIDERNELMTFVGECVFENRAFPSMKMGIENITIQELLNVRSDNDLRQLGIAVNQAKSKFDPDFSITDTFKVGGVDGDKFVKILKLILKHRYFEAFKISVASKLQGLKMKRSLYENPDEIAKKIDEEIVELIAFGI